VTCTVVLEMGFTPRSQAMDADAGLLRPAIQKTWWVVNSCSALTRNSVGIWYKAYTPAREER